ncbi:tRNA guanylyltransferase [Pyrenophora tritici-repentis]|nr:tRNA guanylyltransferase [Pyrenophora tritici-repentis]
MANSKYEYVRRFEKDDGLLENTWIVVRIDGRGFSKFTAKYEFVKPNDKNGLDVMNAAAKAVMKELPDLVMAFGNSDEFSFVFHKDCALFDRRASKLTTTIVSTFTAYYVYSWSLYFPDKPLTPPLPSFDGRAVLYPSDDNLRDYLSWRQVDCHINNLYNTTFWALVQKGGMGAREAEQRLKGTVSSEKNEILFKEFGINYNNEPDCFKKGTVLYRDFFPKPRAIESEKGSATARPIIQTSFPSEPIASPALQQAKTHKTSRSVERAIPYLPDQKNLLQFPDTPRKTFLSETSTPSPPPSPKMISRAAFPNPLRCNPSNSDLNSYVTSSMPLSPPSTATWYNKSSTNGKPHLPSLTPLPLSPPTLKPSRKTPQPLNVSPEMTENDFPADYPIAGYRHHTSSSVSRGFSHSASASMGTVSDAQQVTQPRLKQRSPSQPTLPTYFASSATHPVGPPSIPLRISSIPANNKPRKLSLPAHRSNTTGDGDVSPHDTVSTPTRRVSPPLQKNKALPSPPMSAEEENRTREKVIASSPRQETTKYATTPNIGDTSPPRRASESSNRAYTIWPDGSISHPGLAELHAISSPTSSSPTSATLQYPHASPDMQALTSAANTGPKSQPYPTTQPFPSSNANIPPQTRLKEAVRTASSTKTKSSGNAREQKTDSSMEKRGKHNHASEFPASGAPVQMSRTQKDKDRKKKCKAAVLMEHVDVIKDEFWEKRPWILSGRTG